MDVLNIKTNLSLSVPEHVFHAHFYRKSVYARSAVPGSICRLSFSDPMKSKDPENHLDILLGLS